ncbi:MULTISPECIES: glycosyltransferase family 2 protein [Pseudofrankia]|uniref:glycosyltransferase family 2 protein n=1 Tax=Pseudofrankia TaxID=2994363 RepID=UPI000234BF19|nr:MULTISPECIES: glycosyltransferase family 2 protein [Pseudofrankia]
MTVGEPRPRVSIVIPTLNEARNLPHIFKILPADAEVVLVDGRSTDGTEDVAQSMRPDCVVVHQTRKGKGNALASGFAAATGDIIVMLDADGSADPAEIEDFVQALLGGADYAKGSRFIEGGGSSDITKLRSRGNLALSSLVNILLRHRFTDLCYGYNAFWAYCLPVLDLQPGQRGDEPQWGDGFEVETLINIRAARGGLKIVEVASFEHPRLMGVTNLNALSDGLRVLRTIFAEAFRPMPSRLRRQVALDRQAVRRRLDLSRHATTDPAQLGAATTARAPAAPITRPREDTTLTSGVPRVEPA